jgi:RNA polymerase sigma factor (sigma-70 family)
MSYPALRNYFRAAAGNDTGGAADADLLGRFAVARDESAFELLVWRHAALVKRVCRAVLRDHHTAEDAVQATFLVVARKAGTFAGRGSVVGWLYRIARRVSARLARQQARRPVPSERLDQRPAAPQDPSVSSDEAAAVCAEIDRLPERYRVPVLLCFFEGLTHAEAARRTGWPLGTVAGRLARAKELLARRLSRRGVGLGSVVLAVPAGSFVGSTAHAAALYAGGQPVCGVEPSVVHLAEGALRAMTASTWKLSVAAAVMVCALTAGVWGFPAPQGQQPAKATAPPAPAQAQAAAGPRVADAKQRIRSMNNLKQIMIAMHAFHDVNNQFPRDITDKDGRPILSWRVAILPFLEQDALFKEFKLDEPWDSEHNKKLLTKMPVPYRVGIEPKDATKTYYQGFSGPGTIFEPGKNIKIFDILDGTSNTLGVVEGGSPVEWTRPADIPYHPKNPLVRPELPFSNVFTVALCDGSVAALRPDLDEKILRLLIERDDGNPINLDNAFAKFGLTKEEVKEAQDILRQNEKLLAEIADQLREQQKLIAEVAKKRGPDAPVKGVDLERLMKMQKGLEHALEQLKKETEELRQQAGEKK